MSVAAFIQDANSEGQSNPMRCWKRLPPKYRICRIMELWIATGRIAVAWIIVLGMIGCADRGVAPPRPTNSTNSTNSTDSTDSVAESSREGQANLAPPAAGPLFPAGPADDQFPQLHNLLRVSDRIYSGAEPVGEEAFAQLAQLGIRTVVSVDGARPDLPLAERHGLRYVHIPIGYDGISLEAGQTLRRLVRDAEGPYYIHCHHGVHRGPAAAAIACVAEGIVSGSESLAVLERAGTSRGYGGLWRDVRQYVAPPADQELPALVAEAQVPSLAAAMAILDRAADNLKLCQTAGWQTPVDHPDLVPAQEALLLHEGFRESVRQLEESNDYDEQFLKWMRESDERSGQVLLNLQADEYEAAGRDFTSLQQQCRQCHDAYRD